MSDGGHLVEVHATLEAAAGAAPQLAGRPVTAAHAGDVLRLVAHVATDGAGAVRWPTRDELGKALAPNALVLDDGVPATSSAGSAPVAGSSSPQARAWQVQVVAAPGDREIGPVPVTLTDATGAEIDRAEAPAVAVHVDSVLDARLAADLDRAANAPDMREAVYRELAPTRGPWRLSSGTPWLLILLALVAALALALLGWWAWRRRRRPTRPRPPVVLEPADVVARRRLAVLLASGSLERGEHLAFHVELAEILKEYLERRLGADLRDRTTEEIRRLLHGELKSAASVPQVRGDALSVLVACDLVKFARDAPPPTESRALAQVVARVVDVSSAPTAAAPSAGGSDGAGVPPNWAGAQQRTA